MNERFWLSYYWIMIGFFVMGLIELIFIIDDGYDWYYEGRQIYPIDIGFPYIFIFLIMTLVRYITIGKHFWNRP